ncbi:UDP-phosphate galactose phosphotransferase, partial [Klebsiella variicola]
MTHLAKNIGCTIALVVSDFISFVLSLYLAVGLLAVSMTDFETRVPGEQLDTWILLHLLLGVCCVA